jgi:hypothetical protein
MKEVEVTPIKVYISGPITGYDLAERQAAFALAEDTINSMPGYKAVNPMRNGLPADASRPEHMRADLRLLLDCQSITFLPGWQDSPGCLFEHYVASVTGLGMEFLLDDFPRVHSSANSKE